VKCFTCRQPIPGQRKRKYCSIDCRPSRQRPRQERRDTCLFCNAAMIQPRAAGNPKKYCNRQCASKMRQQQKPKAPTLTKTCVICSAQFTTTRKNQWACSKPCSRERSKQTALDKWEAEKAARPPFRVKQCAWCDEPLEVPSTFKGVIKYHQDCSKPARQSQYRIKSIRRQTKLAGTRISHDEIAERDGYICHLCHDVVDMTLPRTHRYGATLDHLTPLSLGGEDTKENVKLAHWICNIRRSNKPLGDANA